MFDWFDVCKLQVSQRTLQRYVLEMGYVYVTCTITTVVLSYGTTPLIPPTSHTQSKHLGYIHPNAILVVFVYLLLHLCGAHNDGNGAMSIPFCAADDRFKYFCTLI